MFKQLFTLPLLCLAAACAKAPGAVEAARIDSNLYTGLSCHRLQVEQRRMDSSVRDLSSAQQAAATGDTIGVFLIGVPTSSLTGADKEAELSLAKGQRNAIELAMARKGCTIHP